MHILLMGDGLWAALSAEKLVEMGHKLQGIVSRWKPSDNILEEKALELGVSVFRPRRVNDESFLAVVRELSPELGISVAYNQILRRSILEQARFGFINLHAGALPRYRGRNVINWALINGEKSLGLTAHYIDEGIDTGDIILQETLPIEWTDTYGSILARVVEAMPAVVGETVDLIEKGQATPRRQDEDQATYFSGREEGDEWLDWSDSSANLHNKIRAISHPGPGARTMLDGQQVIIWEAFCNLKWPHYIATPGQVVGKRPGIGSFVKTGDSILLIKSIQVADGRVETPSWPIGKRFLMKPGSHLN